MKCWLYFLLWAEYFLIYFLILDLIKTEQEIQTIFALLIIAGIISVLSAIYQQFVGSELHAIGAITETGKTYYRLATPFGFYSNHFGAYLLIILSLLLQLYFASTKGRRFGYLLLILPTLYALFYTFSRGSFLGLIALVIVLLIFNKEQRKKIVFFSIILTILSLIIFSPVFLRWSKKANIKKSGRIVIEYNIRERLSQWEASWDQFSKHPIIGKGFETYRYRAINYQSNFGFVKYIDHPDNAYAKMLIESGILGLLFFGMFVFQVFSFGQKLLKQEIPDQLKLIIYITLTSLPCFLVTSLTDSMFTVGRVLGPIVVLVGIMFARARIESIKI
jgi:O-antigen ligase